MHIFGILLSQVVGRVIDERFDPLKMIDMKVAPSTMIIDLKKAIFRQFGLDNVDVKLPEHHLIFKGREVTSDSMTVQEVGIDHNDATIMQYLPPSDDVGDDDLEGKEVDGKDYDAGDDDPDDDDDDDDYEEEEPDAQVDESDADSDDDDEADDAKVGVPELERNTFRYDSDSDEEDDGKVCGILTAGLDDPPDASDEGHVLKPHHEDEEFIKNRAELLQTVMRAATLSGYSKDHVSLNTEWVSCEQNYLCVMNI